MSLTLHDLAVSVVDECEPPVYLYTEDDLNRAIQNALLEGKVSYDELLTQLRTNPRYRSLMAPLDDEGLASLMRPVTEIAERCTPGYEFTITWLSRIALGYEVNLEIGRRQTEADADQQLVEQRPDYRKWYWWLCWFR